MTDDVTVELIVLTVPTVRSGVVWVTGLGHISVVDHVTGGDASRIRHHPPSRTSQSRLRSARNTCGGRDSCESHSTQPDPRKRKTTIKSRSLQIGSARPNRDPQMPKRMDQTQTLSTCVVPSSSLLPAAVSSSSLLHAVTEPARHTFTLTTQAKILLIKICIDIKRGINIYVKREKKR